MNDTLKTTLWQQFGAAIDMLGNAITACPDRSWDTDTQFWYRGYHTIFFLDYYLADDAATFLPPAPFTLSEMDPAGVLPERVYSKAELLTYLKFCRQKCYSRITTANDTDRFVNEYRNYSFFEILLYNMRHVQHHTAQLNMLLRQGGTDVPGWVSQAGELK